MAGKSLVSKHQLLMGKVNFSNDQWSIYNDLEIEHLDRYINSSKGQFELMQTDSGETLIIGTTWYHHNIWPGGYWKFWSVISFARYT